MKKKLFIQALTKFDKKIFNKTNMEYIRVTKENLEQEHICCAISNNKDVSKSETQNAPTPITTYAFFHDGEYLTNEQMNDKRFLKVIND